MRMIQFEVFSPGQSQSHVISHHAIWMVCMETTLWQLIVASFGWLFCLVTGALFSCVRNTLGLDITGDWAHLCLSFMLSPSQKLKIARQFPKKVKTLDFHALHLQICLWNCNLIGMHVSELNILRAQCSAVLFLFLMRKVCLPCSSR